MILLIFNFLFAWVDIEDMGEKELKAYFYQTPIHLSYEKAMESYLNGNTEKAGQDFLLITLKAYDFNWSFEERKIIAHAFLRYCQVTPKECPQVYKNLVIFDPEIIPHINTDLFPPPMIEKLHIEKSKLQENYYHWRPTQAWQNYSYFIVNGKIYSNTKELIIPLPIKRFRFIAHDKKDGSYTYVGNLQNFLKENPLEKRAKQVSRKKKLDLSITPIQNHYEEESSKMSFFKNKRTWVYTLIAGGITYMIYKNREKKSSSSGAHTSKN